MSFFAHINPKGTNYAIDSCIYSNNDVYFAQWESPHHSVGAVEGKEDSHLYYAAAVLYYSSQFYLCAITSW